MNNLIQTLAARKPLPSLKPEAVWDKDLDAAIASRSGAWTASLQAGSRADGLSFVAGLYLCNESLDASHTLSQNIETPAGSYWHGIMHRMEGDYWNSKYWMRRVGRHPIYPALRQKAVRLLNEPSGLAAIRDGRVQSALADLAASAEWDPSRFVDAVEMIADGQGQDAAAEELLQKIQWHEMCLLLAYCYRSATGDELPAADAGAGASIEDSEGGQA
ncbi:hypothetical protein [Paenibacillus ginsengarvi]|uniref:Uncharacterized protein n=1 Tax=Paenibacillus ginsengarvi TaxID=400777 RepID=A0A3B0CJM9_9BACL|nr:hypothetical protein [Paenibacillus ginsengarvi]RKN84206.1 hypothetical protein D7M11_14460 [Paenibacillus ginsengarvi]